ncbi:MAG: type I 3-dehydroquinate dehydratase [Phycisphaerales bacterium]
MPCLVCVPLMVDDPDAALHDARLARDAGADLVEYRIDRLFDPHTTPDARHDIARLAAESPLPCIITCRSADEGGEYDGDDDHRIALYQWLATGAASGNPANAPRYLDIEHATLERSGNLRQKVRAAVAHPHQPRDDTQTALVLSTHDHEARPADLYARIARMREEPAASIIKIAYRARSLRDNLDLFDILEERDRPTIALGMGEFGLMSRILAPKFNAFLTFASLRPAETTAPGQPTIDELLNLYRFRSIDRDTRLYAVIGWPVAHSLSPALHNPLFHAANHNAVYLPLPIPPEWEHFKATTLALLDAPRLHFSGASVTAPHKEHLLRLAMELAREDTSRRWIIDPTAQRAGAANTLAIDPITGDARILNTDANAILHPLRGALNNLGLIPPPNTPPTANSPEKPSLAGISIGILGAGGAARAAAAALAAEGARITICNRTHERAQNLAARLNAALSTPNIAARPWEDRADAPVHAWINTTTLGMRTDPDKPPDPDATPLAPADLDRAAALPAHRNHERSEGLRLPLIFETIYAPPITPLLAAAGQRGLATITGLTMFIRQAAAQSHAWTGAHPSLTQMQRILDQKLERT